MPDAVTITIQIPQHTWETIQRLTEEMQERARRQGMEEAVFDPCVHAAVMLEQAVDMVLNRMPRTE